MADEYIRRDDAIKIAERYGLSNGSVLGRHTGLADCIASEISCLPADDVAPVVRCKDCKYWQDNNDGYPHEECRWGHGETPDANDFCSYGERKEGAE